MKIFMGSPGDPIKKGKRVSVPYNGKWLDGTVVKGAADTDGRCILIRLDQKVHDGDNLDGHGVTIYCKGATVDKLIPGWIKVLG